MLKMFTREGRFECGLDEQVRGKLWCFTVGNHHAGIGWGLGVAIANEAGFIEVPLTWCNASTREAMMLHVEALNAAENVAPAMAQRIIASTLSAKAAAKALPAAVAAPAVAVLAEIAQDFHQRTRKVLDALAMQIDDRRRLLIMGAPISVDRLRSARDWQDAPSCFAGDRRIIGSFAGVPVLRDELQAKGGLIITLAGREVGAVLDEVYAAEADARGEQYAGGLHPVDVVRRTSDEAEELHIDIAFPRGLVFGDPPAAVRELMRILTLTVAAAGGKVSIDDDLIADAPAWAFEMHSVHAGGGFTVEARRRADAPAAARREERSITLVRCADDARITNAGAGGRGSAVDEAARMEAADRAGERAEADLGDDELAAEREGEERMQRGIEERGYFKN